MSVSPHPKHKDYTLSTFGAVTTSAKFSFPKANRFGSIKL